jgi:aspartyl protease family protein
LAASLSGLSPTLPANADQDDASGISAEVAEKQVAEKQDAHQAAAKYSPDVVIKATKILKDIGLKRSGKTITATNTSELSRAISNLTRERRQLKLVRNDWQTAKDQQTVMQQQMRQLHIRDGELNLQLARVGGVDQQSDNRIVATINAGRNAKTLLAEQITKMRDTVALKREALTQAEASYAEMVLAIRKDFDDLVTELANGMAGEKAKIAFEVMHRNFQTPPLAKLSSANITASIEKRLQKIEQDVFSKTIPLDVRRGGSLFVDVVVGKKAIQMVVDSGATLVTLTSATASELGIKVPNDAPELKLVMADGRDIPAKAIVIARMRVGEFEAENVRTAVLAPSADGAEPLLGMSYLGNFKFEINANEKTLKMLRVATE